MSNFIKIRDLDDPLIPTGIYSGDYVAVSSSPNTPYENSNTTRKVEVGNLVKSQFVGDNPVVVIGPGAIPVGGIPGNRIEPGTITADLLDPSVLAAIGGTTLGINIPLPFAGNPGPSRFGGAGVVWDTQVGGLGAIPLNVKEVLLRFHLHEARLWYWHYMLRDWYILGNSGDNCTKVSRAWAPIGTFPLYGTYANWMINTDGYQRGRPASRVGTAALGGGSNIDVRGCGYDCRGTQNFNTCTYGSAKDVGEFSPIGGLRLRAYMAPEDENVAAVGDLRVIGYRT